MSSFIMPLHTQMICSLLQIAGDLQALLHLINVLVTKIVLKFNPNKCWTLHYSNKPLRDVERQSSTWSESTSQPSRTEHTSKDQIFKNLALKDLEDIANYRHQSTRIQNKEDFVDSAPGENNSNKYKSPWSRARIASWTSKSEGERDRRW